MAWKSSLQEWGSITKSLHWLVALAVLGLLAVGLWMTELPNSPDKIAIYKLHKSVGLTVLALMALRVAWRISERARPTPPPMPAWQRRASKISHGLLYVCLLVMPLSGWLYNSASNFPLKWFELFRVPPLSGADRELKALAGDIHEFTAWLLIALIALHVAAALKHHLIERDGVLRAMLPFGRKRERANPPVVP
jgi:cytochrome b561